MKKRMIIGLVLLIVMAIGMGIFLFTRPSTLKMDQVFPSKALMYGRLSHVATDLNQLAQSEFWKNISTVDVPKVLARNKVSSKDVVRLQKTQKEIEVILNSPLTKKFLGTEMALGVYDKEAFDIKGVQNSYDVLFATRLGFSLQMAELFVSMAHQWSDDVTTSSESYNGFNIVHVHFSKRRLDLQYMRIHDILLVSFYPSNILHRVIDAYLKKQPSLVLDEDFSKISPYAYPKGHGVLFINVQRFLGILKTHIPPLQQVKFQKLSDAAAGFKSYSLSFSPDEVSKMKMIMYFEPKQLNHYWQALSSCAESKNLSLRFVPHSAIAYNWGQCYDFKELWNETKERIDSSGHSKEGLGKWKHRLEKRFKIDVDNDVLPVLGSQVGWYLNDVDTQGLFPYPRGVAFIKIENREAAENLMQKVTKNPLVEIKEEDYQQSAIHYMTLPLGANMDPGYAFLGDYLLLGTSKESLKTSIDAFSNSNQSLESSETLRQFQIKSTDINKGVTFFKIDDISGRLQQLLDWYNKTISSQITGALAYQQEAQDRKKDLEESFGSKKEELVLAQKKLKVLQSKILPAESSEEEKVYQQENIDHMSLDIKQLQEDVDSYDQQKKELQKAFVAYQGQAEAAKLWLFNSEEVLMPFLKGFESLHALGIKWHLNGQVSETEIFVK
ncbi:MAG: DUF3352 domain-containing protein [Candidatus Omnitrophica bacterium]|nr:DUF3352 domain-containing protein [Candidatus Omnitrophota bacterium]